MNIKGASEKLIHSPCVYLAHVVHISHADRRFIPSSFNIQLHMNVFFNTMELLEHNMFRNISKRPAFMWQTQIQMIEYGLDDTIIIQLQKKEVTLILY